MHDDPVTTTTNHPPRPAPRWGKAVRVRLFASELAELERLAHAQGIDTEEAARRLVTQGLGARR